MKGSGTSRHAAGITEQNEGMMAKEQDFVYSINREEKFSEQEEFSLTLRSILKGQISL